jgi:hypothetical protein
MGEGGGKKENVGGKGEGGGREADRVSVIKRGTENKTNPRPIYLHLRLNKIPSHYNTTRAAV